MAREGRKVSEPMLRLDRARQLKVAGRFEEAAVEALWVWENSLRVDPPFYGVRHSFLVSLLGELALSVPSLKGRLEALRNEAERKSVEDFLSLNRALADEQRSLDWFHEVKGIANDLHRNQNLIELLNKRQCWRDLAQLFPSAIAAFKREVASIQTAVDALGAEEERQEIRALLTRSLPKTAVMLMQSSLAAGRVKDAAAVRASALKADRSPEMRAAIASVPMPRVLLRRPRAGAVARKRPRRRR